MCPLCCPIGSIELVFSLKQEQALHAFEEAHDEAFKQFRKDLSAALPNVWRLEVLTSTDTGDGPRMVLGGRRLDSLAARVAEGGELTPVMAVAGWTWKPSTR